MSNIETIAAELADAIDESCGDEVVRLLDEAHKACATMSEEAADKLFHVLNDWLSGRCDG